ncbi:unnamed protein product [Thlaspi arvense]|uniref:Uncharacterized protein n=1 Tax=Thlaspi arvense TaxID=13288 RepID=A0AAU9RZ74_THLAR|nr:unnamed protein product [Thlaspi arvense]
MIGCFKDPTYVLMRVLLCKIQCPSFICFCKPSPHIYASEDCAAVVGKEEDCGVEEKKEEEEGQSHGEILRSSLKRAVSDSEEGGRKEKKKVQWVDLMGKELAEIREFESSEEDDIRYDGDKSCVCVIL